MKSHLSLYHIFTQQAWKSCTIWPLDNLSSSVLIRMPNINWTVYASFLSHRGCDSAFLKNGIIYILKIWPSEFPQYSHLILVHLSLQRPESIQFYILIERAFKISCLAGKENTEKTKENFTSCQSLVFKMLNIISVSYNFWGI